MGSIGYKHYTINHSHRFKRAYVIGANTLAKGKSKAIKGCPKHNLQIYLDAFTFRKLYSKLEIGLFNEVLLAIGRMQEFVKLE